ncbi:MAG: cell division protein FtsQ/DivIB, partial [Gammaproteobacteria bacterium]|nr:cell division protein FtsQ/DivIB [Gammaproteobacteria bacterium]
TPVEIEKAIAPYLSGGLMSANLDAIRRAVEAIPWVDQVRVQRRWPTSLGLTVIEQTPAARWNGTGLLNRRGELFIRDATLIPPELPALSGPPGSESQVAQLYLANEPLVVEAGMRIAAVRLDARGAWEVDLSNGLTVRLGRSHVEQRLQSFVRTAAPIVAQRVAEIAYVDMRYANGFAVGWRTVATPAAGTAAAPGTSGAGAKPPAQARTPAPAPAAKTHVDHEA